MACCCHIPMWIVWITAAGNFTNNQHRTSVIFVANRGEENEWGDNSDLVTYITADTQSGFRAVGPITQFSPLSCWGFPSSFYSLSKLFKPSPQYAVGSSYASILPLALWRWSLDFGTITVSLKWSKNIFLDGNICYDPTRYELGPGGALGVHALWVRWWGGTHLGWGQGLWGGTIWFSNFSHFSHMNLLLLFFGWIDIEI